MTTTGTVEANGTVTMSEPTTTTTGPYQAEPMSTGSNLWRVVDSRFPGQRVRDLRTDVWWDSFLPYLDAVSLVDRLNSTPDASPRHQPRLAGATA